MLKVTKKLEEILKRKFDYYKKKNGELLTIISGEEEWHEEILEQIHLVNEGKFRIRIFNIKGFGKKFNIKRVNRLTFEYCISPRFGRNAKKNLFTLPNFYKNE